MLKSFKWIGLGMGWDGNLCYEHHSAVLITMLWHFCNILVFLKCLHFATS